jgi:CDGSH-type Zn-finger protein
MSEAKIAQKAPYAVELSPGEYWYCTCGRSATQPFCDGAHQGTSFTPQAFTVDKKDTYYVCGCKRTEGAPFCDGTHKSL